MNKANSFNKNGKGFHFNLNKLQLLELALKL